MFFIEISLRGTSSWTQSAKCASSSWTQRVDLTTYVSEIVFSLLGPCVFQNLRFPDVNPARGPNQVYGCPCPKSVARARGPSSWTQLVDRTIDVLKIEMPLQGALVSICLDSDFLTWTQLVDPVRYLFVLVQNPWPEPVGLARGPDLLCIEN